MKNSILLPTHAVLKRKKTGLYIPEAEEVEELEYIFYMLIRNKVFLSIDMRNIFLKNCLYEKKKFLLVNLILKFNLAFIISRRDINI